MWVLDGPVVDWISSLPLQAAAALEQAAQTYQLNQDSSSIRVPAHAVASFSEAAARELGLPPKVPLGFDVRLSGAMGKPGATLAIRWLQPGKTVSARGASVEGPWVHWDERLYRIPSPMYEALQLADEFNRVPDEALDEQFRVWARLRELLGEDSAGGLTDGFLRSFRVVTATALSWSLSTDQRGDIQLDPVLLTSQQVDDGQDPVHLRALTEEDESVFAKRLDQLRSGASAFPLHNGTYVVVDEGLQQALAKVKELRQASPAQRRQAALRPEAMLKEMLGVSEDATTVFVETERYADRVRDIAEWVEPVLPWIKVSPQKWDAPTACGLRIGGVEFPLSPESVMGACDAMREAIATGKSTVDVDGVHLPVSAANLAALEQLQQAVQKRNASLNSDVVSPDLDDPASGKKVLVIETNHDDNSFQCSKVQERGGKPGLPGGLKTPPKVHQELGIRWLQAHWTSGSKGALLCDDMGLGKTYQSLAFLQWLREQMDAGVIPSKPLLVVAPVGLLRNWEREIQSHLLAPGIGDTVLAYGEHLKALRRGKHRDGTAGLDTASLSQAQLVLANYEAVSDYQLSFGAVNFAAVVLDEAQKVKSPKARMTHAIKGLNCDFMLAMTGTPVENRLADLWCIADAVQPGALGDLKEFSQRFETPDADVSVLRSLVWQEEEDTFEASTPRMLLRRLKSDKLEGLPPKHEHVIRKVMPARQHEAYSRALAMKELSGPEGVLGMIHALRRTSLHPALTEGGAQAAGEIRVEDSARMQAMIEVLDQVAREGEKALIFLESLDLQEATQLPTLLKRRYGLKDLPMVINGEVGANQRQERVEKFQETGGFDVMLLSPKAGGVGLTLTAANHVIHLSRWWNPAVEDQCSDRVYRIGQTKPVHIYYPLALIPGDDEHSFDTQLQMLMERKRRLAQNLLAAPAFSREDYAALLSGIGAAADVR
ncbi:helicase-like protein [Roseateles toxinivorans]|uniref:Helicase-like protein n=2 Tax=Roseateles toxinivorans TaxID=270368 RepID=A0A4R6QUQ9_9BURK|nr:helicase-like protein [Roseateles toxinivorans]